MQFNYGKFCEHIEMCPKEIICHLCKYPINDLKTHFKTDCPHTQFKCEACDKTLERHVYNSVSHICYSEMKLIEKDNRIKELVLKTQA